VDGHDPAAIHAAITQAQANHDQPTLICCKTVIGFGSPNKQGTAATHGAPLGADEIALVRKALDWDEPPFVIAEAVADAWNMTEAGQAAELQWNERLAAYTAEHAALAGEFDRRMNGALPADWATVADTAIARIDEAGESVATRKASLIALNAYAADLPELLGGSADLTGSNLTHHSASSIISGDDASGNYISYGVREFAMAAIMNGLAVHGGFIPYGGTFLTFSDYSRNALRMAALMGIRTIHVFTHDSIGLGEDGPTHQPIEQVASLQLIPNMRVWRPCDGVETAVAWRDAIETTTGPTSLILTRQGLAHQSRTAEQLASIRRGAYILRDADDPELILIATGSEVALAMSAADALTAAGHRIRVVSMPCVAAYLAQDAAYREAVLPAAIARRIAIEAGATGLWYRFVGLTGQVIGLDRFGESAPAGELFKQFGFTPENIVAQALRLLES